MNMILVTSIVTSALAVPAQPVMPDWATEAWIDYAAHIVASEAWNVPSADLAVACTLVRDVRRGWQPWALHHRWYGWAEPDEADYAAVRRALTPNGCDSVPEFAFVGNLDDLFYWRSIGMVGDGPFVLYIGDGAAVVGVPIHSIGGEEWRPRRSRSFFGNIERPYHMR